MKRGKRQKRREVIFSIVAIEFDNDDMDADGEVSVSFTGTINPYMCISAMRNGLLKEIEKCVRGKVHDVI